MALRALLAVVVLWALPGAAQARGQDFLHESEARAAAHAWVRDVAVRRYHDAHPSIDGCGRRHPGRVDCIYRFSLKLFDGQVGMTRLSDILHVHKRGGRVWVIDVGDLSG